MMTDDKKLIDCLQKAAFFYTWQEQELTDLLSRAADRLQELTQGDVVVVPREPTADAEVITLHHLDDCVCKFCEKDRRAIDGFQASPHPAETPTSPDEARIRDEALEEAATLVQTKAAYIDLGISNAIRAPKTNPRERMTS